MSSIECSYCHSNWKEDKRGCCSACGAPNKISKLERYDPYDVEGYIVYSFRDHARRCMDFCFYKGRDLIGKVIITDREIETWNPTLDPTPIILERLHNELNKM